MKLLKDKNILLCVSSSIAIYKALELIRLYIKAGANVKVLMSENSKRFITPLTFESISNNKTLHEGSENWSNEYNHIKITKDMDMVVFAPATAASINKLANGIADTLLIQTLIANNKPLLLCPSMNTNMYEHFSTQKSIKKLKQNGVKILNPISKQLACLDEGIGALANVQDIFYHTCRLVYEDDFWKKKNVLITGGGTKEKIDDVRYIGNFSSGKMAQNLALAFFLRGANVTLLTSANATDLPFKVENFSDTNSLSLKIDELFGKFEYLFMAAAVSDYKAKNKSKGKLKKQDLGPLWSLDLIENYDVLANTSGFKKIGFKAEFNKSEALENAKNTFVNKDLDAICLNVLGDDINFSSECSRITFISKKGIKEFDLKEKLLIGLEIADASKEI